MCHDDLRITRQCSKNSTLYEKVTLKNFVISLKAKVKLRNSSIINENIFKKAYR